jgi:hypothetical protein
MCYFISIILLQVSLVTYAFLAPLLKKCDNKEHALLFEVSFGSSGYFLQLDYT